MIQPEKRCALDMLSISTCTLLKNKIKSSSKKLLTYRMIKGQNYSQWGKDMQKTQGAVC